MEKLAAHPTLPFLGEVFLAGELLLSAEHRQLGGWGGAGNMQLPSFSSGALSQFQFQGVTKTSKVDSRGLPELFWLVGSCPVVDLCQGTEKPFVLILYSETMHSIFQNVLNSCGQELSSATPWYCCFSLRFVWPSSLWGPLTGTVPSCKHIP